MVVLRRAITGVVAAVGAALSLAASPGVRAAAPLVNLPPTPDFDATCVALQGRIIAGYCGYDARTGTWWRATPAREAAALQALDSARGQEGLGALVLPADMTSLTPGEQQFVLVNLERVARGLSPVVALVPGLNALALAGATAGTDPQATGVWAHFASGANWAGDAQPAAAVYRYMYQDGWGGSAAATPNVDCTGPGAAGCWGHRRNILEACAPTCVMGVGTVPPTGDGLGSSAQLFVAYSGLPVPVEYTWTDALLAGAAGGLPPATDPGPLWRFSDLAGAPWAAGAAAFLNAEGVVRGTGPGLFDPGAPVQVQELAAMLGRLLGWPGEPTAAPPGTAVWAAGAVGYARAQGLLPPGTAPSAPASRLQAAGLVVGALRLPAVSVPLPFSDLSGLTPQDLDVLRTAVADGLLVGEAGGLLDPEGGLTRAQAAVLLQRAVLALARAAAAPRLPLPLSSRSLPSGAVLYSAGALRMLAPAAAADPVLYWESGTASEPVLLEAANAWWSGAATWTPEPVPAWAQGATSYGRAVITLWPAGQEGIGPALFEPTVRTIAFGSDVQVLLPGAAAWQAASAGALSDPARAVALALIP